MNFLKTMGFRVALSTMLTSAALGGGANKAREEVSFSAECHFVHLAGSMWVVSLTRKNFFEQGVFVSESTNMGHINAEDHPDLEALPDAILASPLFDMEALKVPALRATIHQSIVLAIDAAGLAQHK